MRSIGISTFVISGCMLLGSAAQAQSAATVAAEKQRSREFGSTITAPMVEKYKTFLDRHPNIRRDFSQKYELAVDGSYINSHPRFAELLFREQGNGRSGQETSS
jgi:hypothetical protein